MAPTKQKALLLDSKFGNFVVDTADVPKPEFGRNHIQKGGIYVKSHPAIVGIDIAGNSVELGKGVTNVAVGDKIFVQANLTNERAVFQQYVIEKADIVAKIPDNRSYGEATTLNIYFVTAYLCLFNKNPYGLQLPNPIVDECDKSSGQALVILGASGTLQLAGFSTVVTTASLKHADFLKSLGPTHAIDCNTSKDTLKEEVLKISGGQPVKNVFNAISSRSTWIVIVLGDSIQPKVEGKEVSEVHSWLYAEENYHASVALFKSFTALLEEGVIKPVRVEVLPNGLAGIPEGLKRLEANKVSGFKLVARPQETP